MRRLVRFIGTPFGLATVACLVLAGWALWSGGVLDGPIAREVRVSSVYAAPGVQLDEAAAEQVIGNRRLVVVLLPPGADLRDGCRATERAADGTLVLAMSREVDGEGYDTYGCAWLPGRDDANFGRAAVAETTIARGADQFADDPVEALKVIVVNYDLLVRAGTIPDGARTISPSLPRYLVAAAAVLAVGVGAASIWLAAWRAGRRAARQRARRQDLADRRSQLSAAAAVLAQQIIDLDGRYAQVERALARGARASAGDGAGRSATAHRGFVRRYRRLTMDYAEILPDILAADAGRPAVSRPAVSRPAVDEPDARRPDARRPDARRPDLDRPDLDRPDLDRPDLDQLVARLERLSVRANQLAASPADPGN
ncbi:hypothetical protein O7623_10710 [Solwaraspora sp. WMMD791]|uniref:hypothetical protein n=1 Tax=Solwaraspora sp. WMMD791 TaxID=3016086 RepID=UPI00249ADE67|nr:hypothetical protein [Solwaraspora sp. WMMD791]WFE29617.1 hypothetical protein O7623_10710 [Solwaraspora sp. WMMD791]